MNSLNERRVTIPPFQSKLPPEFVDGLDDRGKYFYTKLDEIGQAQTWLIERKVEDGHILDEIKTQVYETNGQLTQAKIDIVGLKAAQKDAELALDTVKLARKVVWNKWFLIGTVAFFTLGVPFLASHSTWVVGILKILAGG